MEEMMIYEMRVYRCIPGRLPALLKRFETITLKIWEKHGIRQAGFFTTLVGESHQELTYLLAWNRSPTARRNGPHFRATPNGSRRVRKPRPTARLSQHRQSTAGADRILGGE